MSDLLWLSDKQMDWIEPFFPLAHGVPRVDDRRVLSGIVFVIRNGLAGAMRPTSKCASHRFWLYQPHIHATTKRKCLPAYTDGVQKLELLRNGGAVCVIRTRGPFITTDTHKAKGP